MLAGIIVIVVLALGAGGWLLTYSSESECDWIGDGSCPICEAHRADEDYVSQEDC